MNLEALGGSYAALKGPQWVLVGVAIVATATVLWESWEAKKGNYRPALKVAAGIMLSFLGGMAVEQGNWLFRSPASSYRWILDFLLGLACLVLSFTHFMRRRAPRSFIEWLNERNKPPLMFDKKKDD
jgi:hypothetical protein